MYKRFFKRALDIIISLLASIISFPIIGFCALLIKREDGGDVFYNAERLGKDGKCYKMYKLRSMKMNSPKISNGDGTTYNSKSDPRLTKIGRKLRELSIDETPQFWNVLKGDMSFIGPRPDLPGALKHKGEIDFDKKLTVRPGMTGYTQAYNRNELNYEDRQKMNAYYVDHLTFVMDVKILFRTIKNLIMRKSVYRNND